MTTVNLNQSPYFDDYAEGKKFYQILFRPGRAVQARELNQLQTQLKTQLDRIGKHLFENGSQVLPGSGEGAKYANNVGYIKLPSSSATFTDSAENLETYWMGKTVTSIAGPPSSPQLGIRAKVIGHRTVDSINEVRLFLSYLGAQETGGEGTRFSPNQTIATDEAAPLSSTIPNTTTAVGTVSSVTVQEGVYFYNGRFVLVDQQTLFIAPTTELLSIESAWNATPTASVGLKFNESVVAWQDDDSLLDNATGTPNIGAPGADRLFITAELIQVGAYDTGGVQDYVELIKVIDGDVQKRVIKTEYSKIEDYLASRTNDESGDYSVIPFQVQIKEFLRNATNNGAHIEGEFLRDTEAEAQAISVTRFGMDSPGEARQHPTLSGKWAPGTSYNDVNDPTSFVAMCEERLSVMIDPGKAYVKGYPIEKTYTSIVDFKKARTTKHRNNRFIGLPLGNYIYVKNMYGALQSVTYDTIDLYDTPIVSGGSPSGSKIGTARALAVELFSGFYDPSSSVDNRVYRLFLFNIKMTGTSKFEQVKSLYSTNPTFTCDAVLERYRLTGSVSKATRKIVKTATTSGTSLTLTGAGVTTADLRPGMFVTGTGIVTTGANSPVQILAIDSSTVVTLSRAVNTNQASGVNFTFLSESSAVVGQDESTLIGTGTVWRNDQTERLSKDDYIEIDAGQGTAKIYKIAENPSSDNLLKVTANISQDSWLDGSKIDYLYTPLRSDSTNAGLVYKLPDDHVASVRGALPDGGIDSSSIDTVYSTRRIDSAQVATLVSGSLYKISLNAIAGTEFQDFSSSAYSIVITSHTGTPAKAGLWLQVLPYTPGTPSARTAYVRPLGNQLEIYLNSADANTAQFQVESTVIKPGGSVATERPKTLVKGTFNGSGDYVGGYAESTGTDVSVISLGEADVLRITRIVEGPAGYSTAPSGAETLPSGHKDITGLYILDNGQRDYYYDIASVSLRPGSSRPRGRVRVEFDYFTHAGTGDYFSVNSYPFVGGSALTQTMEYGDIPIFAASDGTAYDLSSCLDFRPVVSAGGIDSGFATEMGVPKDDVRCDYHFYEGRKDKLYIDKFGEFGIKTGTPDVNPVLPSDPDAGMVIYELDVAPYTYRPSNVFPTMRDNKRYTMRDIGKLEKRISNLEYYTSLSLLEKDTTSLEIKDAVGNDRFKNGFLVDNFKTFAVSDLGSLDYRCSLDRTTGTLRPLIYEDSIPLFEKALAYTSQANQYRTSHNYQKTGEIYSLPYAPVTMLQQVKASRTINVHPYAVFGFVGAVTLNPWSDEWRETKNAEPLNIKDDSEWQATQQSFGPTGTRIDYQTTVNNWISSETDTDILGKRKNTIVEVAGHSIMSDLGLSASQQKRLVDQGGSVVVPPGYANSGATVPVGRRNFISQQTRTTTTLHGKEITTQFTSSFVDQGFSAPISMGSRIIDTSLIEYIRSRQITFTAKAFMPRARLYPFFDGVDVSAYCKPEGGAYGSPLICDGLGRLTGTFNIPNTTGTKFRTGDRIFRLTTSPQNAQYPAPDSAGDATYTARGWIDTKQESTYSTRLFKTATGTTTSNRNISMVSSSVIGRTEAVPNDPIAQSFYVYESGGCYITSIDVFFKKRPIGSDQPSVTLQVRPLGEEGGPSIKILPFGEVVKEAAEVITNEVNLATGQLTVQGYNGADPKIAATGENSGPWTNGEYNASGAVTQSVPYTYGSGANLIAQMVPTRFTFASPVYLAEKRSYAFVLIANTTEYEVWVAQSGPDTTVADPNEQVNNVEIGTQTPILEDPYFQGVLFKSQNGISWNADQTIDMKFRIWKAKFDTTISGEIDFINAAIPLRNLTLDPFEFSSGSAYVRVLHPNHGHTSARTGSATGAASKVVFSPEYDLTLTGSLTSTTTTVTTTTNFSQIQVGSVIKNPLTGEQRRVAAISGSTLTLSTAFLTEMSGVTGVLATSYVVPSGASLGGVNVDLLFDHRGFDVKHTELDYYQVELGSNATLSGRFGGNSMYATENKRFEEFTLLTTPLVTPETDILWNVQTTTGAGVNDVSSSTYVVAPRQTFQPNERVTFNNPMLIGSYINELPPAGSSITIGGPSNVTSTAPGDRKSFSVRAVLKSTNPNLSPIIDESRMTAYLVANRMDDPYGVESAASESGSVINSVFDEYQAIPTTLTPAVSSTGPNKLYFTSSPSTATGTVTGASGSRTLTGTGTKFLSEVRVGNIVKTSQNEERVVESVVSDTELLLNLSLSVSTTSQALYVTPPNMKIKSGDANISKHLSNLDIGKYLTISGATGTRNIDTPCLILDVIYTPNNTVPDSDLPSSAPKLIEIVVDYKTTQAAGLESNTAVTFIQKDRFIDEIAPEGGSCGAKYVSKKLSVTRPSNALKIMFDASRHESCEILAYYRLELVDSSFTWDEQNWTLAPFNIEVNGVLVNETPKPNESLGSYSEYSATINDLPAFIGAQVKIVMRGGNPARSPRLTNFRMIVIDE